MKFLKNKAKKALMAAVTMSLVMGVCGSAMAANYYGNKNYPAEAQWTTEESNAATTGFKGEWTDSSGDEAGNASSIHGGYVGRVGGAVSNNTVTVSGGNVWNLYGGRVNGGSGAVSNNTVTVSGGTIGSLYGGSAKAISFSDGVTATAEGNTVDLRGGTFKGAIYGGATGAHAIAGTATGTAIGNTVNIFGGTFNNWGAVYGGMTEASGTSAIATAKGNTVNILGGTFNGERIDIYGGAARGNNTFTAEGNTVCIGGYVENEKIVTDEEWVINAPGLTVYGGYAENGTSSGNTVKVMSAGNKIKSLDMKTIQNMEFYIPATAKDGSVMLTVGDSVDLSKANIKAGLENSSELKEGKITLISANEISGFDKDGQPIEKVSIGDFTERALIYEFTDGKNLNAVIGAAKPKDDNPDSKSPVETQAAGLTMLTTGADMLASQGFDNAASAVASEVSAGASPNVMTPFMAMGGAKTKVKSGSHVDVKGWNLNIGLAKEIDNKAGKLLIGPVVEYGKGSYDSYLDNGFHGEGDTDYIGGGVMAKQTNDDGLYYEGSLRFGKLSNDYSSKTGRYDSDSTYYAAHVGLGKIVKLSDKNSLDYYGKYFYTHQKGDDTTLYDNGTPIDLHLDSVDSNRTRIGGRFTHEMNEKNSVYAGLAWQHEFSGTARATLGGTSTPAPSVKGNTGIMELGWKVNANKNLDLDLGATGYTGKQKGASLNLALNFKF